MAWYSEIKTDIYREDRGNGGSALVGYILVRKERVGGTSPGVVFHGVRSTSKPRFTVGTRKARGSGHEVGRG
eukprot:765909-Hanusia_phi.AAC.1